ncbi:hypothetical protein [Pseudalkalibacillus salsuginis]|uniref:hypothetical protein n=1 Tax=Pseudalkalibacillus salsuginis TaxID=2910972 RepID=UPI001F48D8BE|nr:hypothetical protein [Pseudalkalibacillus salsuginis]MCF6410771.1 hypothetical protein [Pseudalkalibacillus salsuginis]
MSGSKKGVERGQTITFRVPSDTPDHLLKQLQRLKETERRNFSSKIAQFVLQGVNESFAKERETITIPLPKQLTKEQRNWLKHEHSEALIGSIMFHLLNDPMRATTLLASLNSNAVNIDEALYLQEDEAAAALPEWQHEKVDSAESVSKKRKWADDDDDLSEFNLDNLQAELHGQQEDNTEEDDDPLGDFLSSMNK